MGIVLNAETELAWVAQMCRRTLEFWARYGPAPAHQGYLVGLRGDGAPYDAHTQNLVASARFVVNFAAGAVRFEDAVLRDHAAHALDFLCDGHVDRAHGGYVWTLKDGQPSDARKVLYGHAFVLLAAASARRAGLSRADALLEDITEVLDRHFSGPSALAEPNYAARDWTHASETRGQNPNMHLCEAFIATYEATGDLAHLERANAIAAAITEELARETPGHAVWESFDRNWHKVAWPGTGIEDSTAMDSTFNVIPGHQAEWAKLLGLLHRHRPEPWLIERARELYDLAWRVGWDQAAGGFYRALDDELQVPPDLSALAEVPAAKGSSKCYWSPPEAIGAAAVLESLTGEARYARDRLRVWQYCREQMIDEARGGWFKAPTAGPKSDDLPKGGIFDPDYHALGAGFETLRSLSPSDGTS